MLIDWEKYIIKGERTLSSGIKSNLFFDFKLLKKKENKNDLNIIVKKIDDIIRNYITPDNSIPPRPVGIHTMGGYIAKLIPGFSTIYYPRLDKLSNEWLYCVDYDVGDYVKYVIIDDVGTTFNTIKKAIEFIGYPPECIVVIVSREDINNGINFIDYFGKRIDLISLFSIYDIIGDFF